MSRRRTRKTFVDLVREVGSVARVRDLSKRRIAARRRRALAPSQPADAILQLKAAGVRFSRSAALLFDRHIVPAMGNARALEAAIAVFGRELDEVAVRVMSSARSAARKAAKHANREYARIMGVQLPAMGVQTGAEDFALRIVQAYRKVARDQTDKLLETLGADLYDLRRDLWVTRNRTQTIAMTESNRFFESVFRMWTQRGGDEFGIWVTRRDLNVRHSHRERDGKVFRLAVGLGGIWPGEEPNCRCGFIPASAELVG